MIKHTQRIRRQQSTDCLSVFDHFMGLALKGLTNNRSSVRTVNTHSRRLL